jgi:hypothetical protein
VSLILYKQEFLSMATIKLCSVIAACSLALSALVPTARAERSMSCQAFRVALWRAIDDASIEIAHPKLERRAGGYGPTIRYELTGIMGLQGQLICWNDQIFNFSASAQLTGDSDRIVSGILQLKGLAGAAICAVSEPHLTPGECTSKADALVRLATEEYAKPHVRTDAQNYGEAGMRLEDGYSLEIEVGEDGVAFFLYGF